MKTGKKITLDDYNNVKIEYGTVDHINLKTIYIELNSWVEPSDEKVNYDDIISKTKKNIKQLIRLLRSEYFKPESIVDLDIRTKGIKLGKKSFMNLEITLYVEKHFDIKTKTVKTIIKELSENIIDNSLNDKKLFNFYKKKD